MALWGHPTLIQIISPPAHLALTSLQLFLFSTVAPFFFFKSPSFSLTLSSPPYGSPGFIEGVCPPPPDCLKWPAHISQSFLTGYPPSSCLSLSFSLIPSLSHDSPFLWAGGWTRVIPVNSYFFSTLQHSSLRHAPTLTYDDNVRYLDLTGTEELGFTWFT